MKFLTCIVAICMLCIVANANAQCVNSVQASTACFVAPVQVQAVQAYALPQIIVPQVQAIQVQAQAYSVVAPVVVQKQQIVVQKQLVPVHVQQLQVAKVQAVRQNFNDGSRNRQLGLFNVDRTGSNNSRQIGLINRR